MDMSNVDTTKNEYSDRCGDNVKWKLSQKSMGDPHTGSNLKIKQKRLLYLYVDRKAIVDTSFCFMICHTIIDYCEQNDQGETEVLRIKDSLFR
uniref:Uncharacterized protein n=1 Tax=Romanomermis culicivorax TaxID=13658 RepID=A0A915JKT1_ROMCU